MKILRENYEWFNKKYSNGAEQSLEDIAELFRTMDAPLFLSERSKKKIEFMLKESLFSLEQEKKYNPALCAITSKLLSCLYPIICPKTDMLRAYAERYHKAIEKQRRKIPN